MPPRFQPLQATNRVTLSLKIQPTNAGGHFKPPTLMAAKVIKIISEDIDTSYNLLIPYII